MYTKVLENSIAKDFFKKNEQFVELLKNSFIIEWFEENNVKLYLLYDNDIIKSFVTLIKMSKDPLKSHINPQYMNYIYTFEQYRRNSYAYYLLLQLKNCENITIFCTDDITKNLFTKAGFMFTDYDRLYKLPIYRFP
jgi:hypothetical protein